MLLKYNYHSSKQFATIIPGIIIFLLTIHSICSGESDKSNQPQQLSSSEWKEKRSVFLKLYNSTSPNKRSEAFEFINKQLYDRLIISPPNYASETMEFLLQVLSIEEDETVASTAKESLAKFLTQSSYLEWMSQNHKQLVTKELAKLRLIDTFGITSLSSKDEYITLILIDFLNNKEEKSFLRLSAINVLHKYCLSRIPHKFINAIMNMIKDPDLNINKIALKIISELKPLEKIEELIQFLGEEKRKETREEIGHTLEIITGQNYKTDLASWQKWWMKQPRSATITQDEVDEAIKKGTDFLMQGCSNMITSTQETELLFYTLIRSGAKIPEDIIQSFLDLLLNNELDNTYQVALLAMALSELDRVKYIERIIQCAEFILANQLPTGGWGYDMRKVGKFINTETPRPITATETTSTKSVRKISIKIPLRRVSYGREEAIWDTSISQYAILGLRACADANIEIPVKIWYDAEQAFSSKQFADGSWNCHANGMITHSMTVGGMGSLAICLFYQGKHIQEDRRIKRAINWLVKYFTITGLTEKWNHYYYIYGLERAGALVGTEFFDQYQWYPLGVSYLLKEQKKDGSWNGSDIDTCFALLFLRRATKPLKIVITDGKDNK
jgi:hypothetical protein